MKKNKKPNWTIIIFFVFLLIMGTYGIYLSLHIAHKNGYLEEYEFNPEFKITTEKCNLENEIILTNIVEHTHSFWLNEINLNNIKNYSIYSRPAYFDSFGYLERQFCFDLLEQDGIYPDRVDVSIRNNDDISVTSLDEDFFVSEIYCTAITELNFEKYTSIKEETKNYSSLYIKIPPFNLSKIKTIESEISGENILQIKNSDRYWSYEVTFVGETEDKEVCNQVEVNEILIEGKFKSYNVTTIFEENILLEINWSYPFICSRDFCSFYVEDAIEISKEDLSIDWLSKKAKCIEYDLYSGRGKCSKYKLEDYTIEVLK